MSLPSSDQELHDSVGNARHSLNKLQKHHASVPVASDLVDLCGYGHAENSVDFTHTEVIVDHLSGSHKINELLKAHKTFLTTDGLAARIFLVDVLKGPQMFLNHNVTALIVEFLLAELGEIELFEKRDHVILKTVSNRMFLSCVAVC